jgi:uncharacterized membrane protein YccF (DUF307 family)
MRTLANILWHIPFLGFLDAFVVFLLGSLLTILVVTAPIGLGLIQYSKFLLTPFSSNMMSKSDTGVKQNAAWKVYGHIISIVWIPFGLILCVITIFQIVGLCITLIGIPMAIILVKSLGTYLNPVHKICVNR